MPTGTELAYNDDEDFSNGIYTSLIELTDVPAGSNGESIWLEFSYGDCSNINAYEEPVSFRSCCIEWSTTCLSSEVTSKPQYWYRGSYGCGKRDYSNYSSIEEYNQAQIDKKTNTLLIRFKVITRK